MERSISCEARTMAALSCAWPKADLPNVLIKVEIRDLSKRGFRVAACKGYINGFATSLKEAGYKITAHKAPDIEKSDFKTPVVVDLTFANDEGTIILVKKTMFFTTKGYDVTVLATDEHRLFDKINRMTLVMFG